MTDPSRPRYDSVNLYEALAERLSSDAKWAEIGTPITYTMVYEYLAPVDKAFYVAFDQGKVLEVTELEHGKARPANFVISGAPEAWKAVLRRETKPTVAMATGKLHVEGRQLTLLKHMGAFSHMLHVLTELDPAYD